MKKNKKLLFSVTKKDLILQTFRSGGPGGQHQNKRDTGVRIKHPASGAVGESREHKRQSQNRKAALTRLSKHPKFRVWSSHIIYKIMGGKTVDEMVNDAMSLENLKIEIQKDGKWISN